LRFEVKKEQLILHRVRLLVLTALLMMLPQWGNQAQRILKTSILAGLGVDPSQVHDQYNIQERDDSGSRFFSLRCGLRMHGSLSQ